LEKSKNIISVIEFRQLLSGLADAGYICIRYRLIGELWSNNFFHVMSVDDKTAVLRNEHSHEYRMIEYAHVMQFEIDVRYHNYHPNFHYDVVPSPQIA
jgi:hypothetical protein